MYALTKYLDYPEPNGVFNIEYNVLTQEEIAELLNINFNFIPSSTNFGHGAISYSNQKKYRESKQHFIKYIRENPVIHNLYNKLFKKIIEVNDRCYQYHLTDVEELQLTKYGVGDYYHQHIDTDFLLSIGNNHRKLSFSIDLTSPEQYKGGDLNLYLNNVPFPVPSQLGRMVFFPSFLLHEVTEVTEGERISLVGWVNGPKFK